MVLAIAYFSADPAESTSICVAYVPLSLIRKNRRGFRCEPASFRDGRPNPRRDYAIFFDSQGIQRLELENWSKQLVQEKEQQSENFNPNN
jgi:hypothetical protein